jgi:hypothetical protein
MTDFFDFRNLLPKAISRYNVDRETRAALICNRFRDLAPSILGQDLQGHVTPKFFRNGTLAVSVENSIWAQRVTVHRHDLIMKLNLQLGKDWVTEIRTLVEAESC